MLTHSRMQAAQATFKSIKSVMPLFDRVLVQRFKAETVRLTPLLSFPLNVRADGCAENRERHLPPLVDDRERDHPRGDRHRRRPRRTGQGRQDPAAQRAGGRPRARARLGRELD